MSAQTLIVRLINQRAPGECLAACAAMVLDYLGRPQPYASLLRLLDIKPHGAPFTNLYTLQRIGVRVLHERNRTFDQLRNHLAAGHPCIVPVFTGELPYWQGVRTFHVVVVAALKSDLVYVVDPAFSTPLIGVEFGDFELAWIERGQEIATLRLTSAG